MKFLLILFIPVSIYCQTMQLGLKFNTTGSFYSDVIRLNDGSGNPDLYIENKNTLNKFELRMSPFIILGGVSLELNGEKYGLSYDVNLLQTRTTLMELGANYSYKFYKSVYAAAGVGYIFTLFGDEQRNVEYMDLSTFAFNVGLGCDLDNNTSLNVRYIFLKPAVYMETYTQSWARYQYKLNGLLSVDFAYKINL